MTSLHEAGGGVGGTWYWNRYPGARSDSPSYIFGDVARHTGGDLPRALGKITARTFVMPISEDMFFPGHMRGPPFLGSGTAVSSTDCGCLGGTVEGSRSRRA